MTREEIKEMGYESSARSPRKRDLNLLKPDVSFRDQLDIDSMGFLNFVIALDEELDVRIPESDYPKLSTLEGCVELLASEKTVTVPTKPPRVQSV